MGAWGWGGGATITFSDYVQYVDLLNCSRVQIVNFVFDLKPLPYTALAIESVDVEASTATMQLQPGHPTVEALLSRKQLETSGIAEVMSQYLGSNLDAAACWERRAGSDRPAAARLEARVRAAKWRNLAGDTAGAAAHVDAVLAARPHDCGALLELGNARRRRRDGDGAAAAYGAAAACDPTWDAPHLNWGVLEIDRENRDAAYGHFRDQLARAPNRGSLRRLKILRDVNEGDPTIAKIVADFEARHAEL